MTITIRRMNGTTKVYDGIQDVTWTPTTVTLIDGPECETDGGITTVALAGGTDVGSAVTAVTAHD